MLNKTVKMKPSDFQGVAKFPKLNLSQVQAAVSKPKAKQSYTRRLKSAKTRTAVD